MERTVPGVSWGSELDNGRRSRSNRQRRDWTVPRLASAKVKLGDGQSRWSVISSTFSPTVQLRAPGKLVIGGHWTVNGTMEPTHKNNKETMCCPKFHSLSIERVKTKEAQ
ncbi:unnamed protein product [Ixodes pacificus]